MSKIGREIVDGCGAARVVELYLKFLKLESW